MLQRISGMLCADGAVSLDMNRKLCSARNRFCQSNLALLTAINDALGSKGHISFRSASKSVEEGMYSKGKQGQVLTLNGSFALEVAGELQPYSVTKVAHFQVLAELAALTPGQSETKLNLHKRMLELNNKGPEDDTLALDNMTPEWLAGFFDGDGSIGVMHERSKGRCILPLYLHR